MQLTGAWTAIADGLRGGKLRGGDLTRLDQRVLVSLDADDASCVAVQFDVHTDVVDVSDTIKVPRRVQVRTPACATPALASS